jgi:hypothetical protein
MIPSNIEKKHIIRAMREIDSNGILPSRESRSFFLISGGKRYPPKYVLSLANKFANGEELYPSSFSGGQETNNFLKRLGFDIKEISPSGAIGGPISSPKRAFERTQKRHDERCLECKKTVEMMLKKIYRKVESNYRFEVNTSVEGYKDFPFYQNLKEILKDLQKYKGHKDFVKSSVLPRCDFFIPNPGFILEFDESQHFTLSRKISLKNYPQNLKLGFSRMKWIDLCEKIDAKDNDPPFRDEQRAWYDTLRDFLPEFKGFEPTVRLYSKEIQWCSLNPENPEDVAKFRDLIQNRRKRSCSWVATVILQSNGKYSNDERLTVLSQIVDLVTKEMDGDGVILFPGGWFNVNKQEARNLYKWVERNMQDILSKKERNIIVSLGIDGRVDQYAKDQIGIAISKMGIEAIGRKFHPAPPEKGHDVELAKDHLSREKNKSRVFDLNGRKYFLCVCYDSFGIRQKRIPNFGIDVILDLVHGFHPKGKDGSGDVYFAKHGFAGASKEWGCLTFGAAVFFNRKIPKRWPSGVYWNQGSKSTQKWRYKDNPIKPKVEFEPSELSIKEGSALVRIYNI